MEQENVEILEFNLNDEEIDELMGKLNELKASKEGFEFEIDDSNVLSISYDSDSEEENA